MNPRLCREEIIQPADGYWRDVVYKKDKDGKDVVVEKGPLKHNVITQPFTVLLAGLLGNEPSFSGGVLYHAIGEGDAAWDTGGIPAASKFATTLLNEVHRQQPDGISYLRWGNGQAQTGSANTIEDPSRIDGCGLVGRFEPDDFFNGMQVEITQGTNAGETRTVLDYEQDGGIITVDSSFPAPIDSTSQYEFVPEVSVDPTNVIEIRTTWDYGQPSDPFNNRYIREQGLFGGTATSAADSGLMIDLIHHERIWKDPTLKLVRFIDLVMKI